MEERAEEREMKRMKLEANIEERRRHDEMKHEEGMQTMMMGFMLPCHYQSSFSRDELEMEKTPPQENHFLLDIEHFKLYLCVYDI